MAPNEVFLDACADGDLQKMQQAAANDSLTAEDLDEGLTLATEGAHSEAVAALFAAGATVSAQALDLLPGKDCKQSPIVIRHFLDQGMSPNVRLSNGEPLLRFMTSAACARELLSRGADPNLTGPSGVGPLVSAIVSADEPSVAIDLVEQLIASGANLTSDLLFAAAAPRVRQGPVVIALLVRKGLDPNVESAQWGTPLHYAVRAGKPDTVKALLDAGANPTTRVTGKHIGENKTPLEVAGGIGERELRETIIDLLRSYGATSRDSAPNLPVTH